jgi:CRISPR-associated protein Csm1
MRQQLYLAALLNQAPQKEKNTILAKAQISDLTPFVTAINNAHNCIVGIVGEQARANETSLASAFCNIVKGENHYYKAAPLSLNKDFFPATNIVTSEADKTNLWSSFLDEVNTLSCDPSNLTPFTETLLHLLHKYTVSLPNPTSYLPDVSFYDHAKMTAAMAICFDQTDNTNEPFLLVKADMSGIQAYIYDVVSKGAAKNLKGRSFYVQLLSDAVLRYLLKEFDLPQANIVYNSGGNFLLLVPNTAGNKTKVDNLEKEIAEKLFAAHKTAIAIIIDYVEIVAKDLVNGTKCITKILADKIDEKKKRKFANHIKNNYSSLFDAQEVMPQDKITGEDIEKEDKDIMPKFKHDVLFQSKDGEDADFALTDLKLLTFQQICLGRRLKKADYLVVANQSLNFTNNEEPKYQINPANLGIYYYLAEDKSDLEKIKTTHANVGLQIYSFNELSFIPSQPNTKHQYGFMLYGGNEAPTFEYNYKDSDDKDEKYHAGETKTFSHLTLRLGYNKDTNGAGNLASIKRLGVMLLDVDGLGTVFKEKNFDSLAQYAAFSRHLDYFFLGYINTLWRENEQFKRHIQVIYAGGDDVFIVGRWDLIIDFAELLQTQLLAWSCQTSMAQQPKISLSGGIATVTHKFPIMKAAAMAGKAEGKAKAYSIPKKDDEKEDKKKNAITLWNTPLNWNLEYPIVQQLKTKIACCIDDDKNDYKGVFRNLQDYYYQHLLLEEEGLKKEKDQGTLTKEKQYTWKYSYYVRWRIAYYIARTQDRYHRDDNFCKLLETLKQGVFCNSYRSNPLQGKHHFFTLLNLAIRWAELNHRTNYKK